MKYKTKIEIIAEAANKIEAIEIVDEFLSGHLSRGINMKCSIKPVNYHAKPVLTCIAISLIFAFGVLSLNHAKPYKNIIGSSSGIDAIQPPLKTSPVVVPGDFKKEWETRQIKETLRYIKK